MDVGVIALHFNDMRGGLARHEIAFSFVPALHFERLSQFGCRIMTKRREQHILHGAETLRIGTAELRDALGKQLEDLPVALGFPRA